MQRMMYRSGNGRADRNARTFLLVHKSGVNRRKSTSQKTKIAAVMDDGQPISPNNTHEDHYETAQIRTQR